MIMCVYSLRMCMKIPFTILEIQLFLRRAWVYTSRSKGKYVVAYLKMRSFNERYLICTYSFFLSDDQSRVRLLSLEGVVGSNYINANYVDGYNHPCQYIATQAPLTQTVGDFWRMCWERGSHIIIMLTNLFERGRVRMGFSRKEM